MTAAPLTEVLRQFRSTAAEECTDQELLQRFAGGADRAAFAALVRRHGPLVLGVCRRILGAGPDLDDAFQPTFVVLLRKPGSIRKQSAVASWLHGVAYRLAVDLKNQRRRRHGRADGHPVEEIPEDQARRGDPYVRATLREFGKLLDEELQQLPAACRDALVACHLEGLSYADAAQRLGWPLGTLKKPLGRARQLLRQRLRRGGVDMSLLALCVSLSEQASAAVPRVLVQATLRCASAAPARVASFGTRMTGNFSKTGRRAYPSRHSE